jgi:YVTN family beta-propeller protein
MALVGHSAYAQDPPQIPLYVGQTVCRRCHAHGGPQGACDVERNVRHELAYAALSRSEAAEIAAFSGIPETPTASRICLACHATAAGVGPRWTTATFDITDGVQCEACHGAGSLHVELAGQTARAPEDVSQHIDRGDRARCIPCHRESRAHREVLELGFRRSPADLLYKTPVNLAVSPDGARLYVVCEHSNTMAVVDTRTRRVIAEVAVGSRPHDVAAGPDGARIYVTNRFGNSVSVIDGSSLVEVAEIPAGAGPHGVVCDPTGRFVFVANNGEDSVSVIDATELRETKRLSGGRGPWSLAVGADPTRLYVTNVNPNVTRFLEPPTSELSILDATAGHVTDRLNVPGANMLQGIAVLPAGTGGPRALFTLVRTKNLVPITRLQQGWTITNGIGVVRPGGGVDQVLLDQPGESFPDPTDIAVSPDGRHALATSGGGDEVAVIDIAKLWSLLESASEADRRELLPNHLGQSGRFVLKRLAVGRNPRSVAFAPNGRSAYVANALDDTVTVIDTARFVVAATIDLGGPAEVTELRRGERLFHSADGTFGRQFSCRSCHPDGHINGLTFDIEADGIGRKPVDNRTLQGIVDTAPFKWEGTNPSLERQCGPRLAVFFTRLHPFTPDELRALVRYESTIERPPNRYRRADGLTLAQRRGKLIFERVTRRGTGSTGGQQGCAACHDGAYHTNRLRTETRTVMWLDEPFEHQVDNMFDVDSFGPLGMAYYYSEAVSHALDVPHLTNVYASPPYLHNGAAATLEEIWTRFNTFDHHGLTSDLTRQQFNELIAYLKSL